MSASVAGEVSVEGKVAVVTGANTGIGKVTALELARRQARVLCLCRSEARGRAAVDEIRDETGNDAVEYVHLDLASFASVRACAEAVLAKVREIDLLVLNAGLAGQPGLTADGFELTFGVNHLGHFLLTHLLLGAVKRASSPRIVVVASRLHHRVATLHLDDPGLRQRTRSVTGLDEYGASKLANILFTAELSRRLRAEGGASARITVNSLHPGGVATEIYRRIPWCIRACIMRGMLTPEEGATTSLYLCLSPSVGNVSGKYFVECREVGPSAAALDADLAGQLWRASEEWCGIRGGYGSL